jgi:catechol 2,3-dioxygenase-like lactoylglutathione lyase family enzyme
MSLLLDHVVIRVRHLEEAVANFSELGFTVQRGGSHADGATHNALIVFDDGSYFELIAFLRDAREHRWWDEGHVAGDGFVDFALLPSSVGAVVEAAVTRGLNYEGPIPGGRTRPDGTRIEWQIGKPPVKDLPFLCGDLTPRFLRVPEGEVRRHANGAKGISTVTVAVNDLDASVRRYRALLGQDFTVHVASLPGQDVRLATFALGTTTFVLLSPRIATGAPAGSFAADLSTTLQTRGEGLIGVSLATAHPANARPLPLSLTHRAPLELV